jgi:hypothetical protein
VDGSKRDGETEDTARDTTTQVKAALPSRSLAGQPPSPLFALAASGPGGGLPLPLPPPRLIYSSASGSLPPPPRESRSLTLSTCTRPVRWERVPLNGERGAEWGAQDERQAGPAELHRHAQGGGGEAAPLLGGGGRRVQADQLRPAPRGRRRRPRVVGLGRWVWLPSRSLLPGSGVWICVRCWGLGEVR